MTEREYTRVACRGVAAGHLFILTKSLEEFRINAESAGIHVNEDVLKIKAYLEGFGVALYSDSMIDQRELVR